MKCQFHFLTRADDGGLQMCSEKVLIICFYNFKMLFQIFVSKEDKGQFFGETAYEKYNSH